MRRRAPRIKDGVGGSWSLEGVECCGMRERFRGWLRFCGMESYLNDNFGGVKPKNSSEEALQRWRKLCWVVKNPKRRFRFTANLSKRFEAQAIRRSNQVILVFIFLTKFWILYFRWYYDLGVPKSQLFSLWTLEMLVVFGFTSSSLSFDYCCWTKGGRSWNCECCELPRLLLAIGF